MKKRLSTTLAILALGVSTSFAQRKTITEDYYKLAVEKIPLSNMPGKQTYSYIVAEDGSHQKDGAYSIRCAINNEKIETYAHTFTISGSFTLNTTYAKGRLNGAITSNYRLNVIGANIFGSTKGGISSSLSGGFLNGVPHGAFKISRDGELKTQLTANYKNGMLVGAFSCSMLNDKSQPARYRGNLTQSGKFTGTWELNGYSNMQDQFQNGVLISRTIEGKSTKPAISALAKKYAEGILSKEQLYEQHNVAVYQDSVDLGELVLTALFRDSGVDFDKLKGYDFSNSTYVKYEYLKELCTLTEAGADILIQNIIDYHHYGRSDSEIEILYTCYNLGGKIIKYDCIALDKKLNRYYIRVHQSMAKAFPNSVKGGSFDNYFENVYISPELMAYIDDKVDTFFKEHALSLQEFVDSYPDEFPNAENIKGFVEGDRAVWNKELETAYNNYKNSNSGTKNERDELYAEQRYIAGTIEQLKDHIVPGLQKIYDLLTGYAKTHPNDDKYMIFHKNDRFKYIPKETVTNCKDLIANANDELKSLKEKLATLEKAAEDARTAAEKADRIEQLKPAFEFILNEWSSDISKHPEVYRYVSRGVELSNPYTSLRPFCPMVSYEIIDITDDTVICKWVKRGKKKTLITYQLELKHDGLRLVLKSFDINKAKQLEP